MWFLRSKTGKSSAGKSAPEAPSRHALGRQAEKAARDFLRREGFRILDANVRLVGAEIDIVAREAETVCFVEVRTMADAPGRFPADTVTRRKSARIAQAALSYMSRRRWADRPMRFDIVAGWREKDRYRFELIRDAFTVRQVLPERFW